MSIKNAVLNELENRFYPVSYNESLHEYEIDLVDEPIRAKCPYRAIWKAVNNGYINPDSILGVFMSDESEDSDEVPYYQPYAYVDNVIDYIHGGLVTA